MVDGFPVNETAIYDDSALVLGLGVSSTALAKARDAGKLRFARQGHRILYLGQWLLDWLESEAITGRVVHGTREGRTRA